MDQERIAPCSTTTLRQELAGFRVTTSRRFSDFSLNRVLAEATHCQLVKDSDKRQVFYLQAPSGEFFLKRSALIRTKDRLRHLFLRRRRWAEWRNLHRLQAAGISAPDPVLKGEKGSIHLQGFFLLTRKVNGVVLNCDSRAGATKLGQFVALLHSRGIYHADLHPENIIIQNNGQPCLIDAQEVFFLPWLPRRLRLYNLGKLYFHLRSKPHPEGWVTALLDGYNQAGGGALTISGLLRAAHRCQQRRYRSRTKRCCKNSTEFVVVKGGAFRGYKRKNFEWGPHELHQALEKGEALKAGRLISFQGVCIKIHHNKLFHQDRCLASWKMSRALEVRNIPVPRSLGYFRIDGDSFFLSEFLVDSILLNDYLSSLFSEQQKRQAIKKLALWLREIHDRGIWQRDFKSSNVMFRHGHYIMVDLDSVRICRHLSNEKKIINLAQLNASIGNAITIRDRLRFYCYYTARERPSWEQRRAVYRKVWKITESKNTEVFGLDVAKLAL